MFFCSVLPNLVHFIHQLFILIVEDFAICQFIIRAILSLDSKLFYIPFSFQILFFPQIISQTTYFLYQFILFYLFLLLRVRTISLSKRLLGNQKVCESPQREIWSRCCTKLQITLQLQCCRISENFRHGLNQSNTTPLCFIFMALIWLVDLVLTFLT